MYNQILSILSGFAGFASVAMLILATGCTKATEVKTVDQVTQNSIASIANECGGMRTDRPSERNRSGSVLVVPSQVLVTIVTKIQPDKLQTTLFYSVDQKRLSLENLPKDKIVSCRIKAITKNQITQNKKPVNFGKSLKDINGNTTYVGDSQVFLSTGSGELIPFLPGQIVPYAKNLTLSEKKKVFEGYYVP